MMWERLGFRLEFLVYWLAFERWHALIEDIYQVDFMNT